MWKSVTQYSLNAKWDISRLHSKKKKCLYVINGTKYFDTRNISSFS